MVAACAHIRQRRVAASFRQAVQQVGQAVEPTRGDGFGIGIAMGAGQHHFLCCNGLLVIMRGQADLTIWQ